MTSRILYLFLYISVDVRNFYIFGILTLSVMDVTDILYIRQRTIIDCLFFIFSRNCVRIYTMRPH